MFRERTAYVSSELIDHINSVKNYPIGHIYNALTQMINTKEVFVDALGRTGYMVNKGKYYVFQPSEITSEQSGMYERQHPVPYKHDHIILNMDEQNMQKTSDETMLNKSGNAVFQECMSNYKRAFGECEVQFTSAGKVKMTAEEKNDWYFNTCYLLQKLEHDYENRESPIDLSTEQIEDYVVSHILDTLNVKNKLELYAYLLVEMKEGEVTDETEQKVLDRMMVYVNERTQRTNTGLFAIVLNDTNFTDVFKYKKVENQWKWEITQVSSTELTVPALANKIRSFETPKQLLNENVLFPGYKNADVKMKIVNINEPRNKGAVIEQKNRSDLSVKLLNQIYGFPDQLDDGYTSVAMCILIEWMSRQKSQTGKKQWILSPEHYGKCGLPK
jgi:hypothetical protein